LRYWARHLDAGQLIADLDARQQAKRPGWLYRLSQRVCQGHRV